jgi:hypothetical protein
MKFLRGIASNLPQEGYSEGVITKKLAHRGIVRRTAVVKVGTVKQQLKAEGAEMFDIDLHMAPKLEEDQFVDSIGQIETTPQELKEVVKDFWEGYEADGLNPEQCADQVMNEMLGSPWLLKKQEVIIFGYLAELYCLHKDAKDSYYKYLKSLETAASE